jgi:STE24 endopeptidase
LPHSCYPPALRLWLDQRHLRHVRAHRDQVPADFFGRIELADHRKAADYTAAKVRLGFVETLVDVLVLLLFTLGGVLALVDAGLREAFGSGHVQGLALFAAVSLIGFVIGLPTSLYRSFVIEERFGFNKLTWKLWLADLAKGAALTVVIGGPLLFAVLWLMDAMGRNWWLYVWLVWLATNLLLLFLYPTVIAPLFNKFTPLEDAALKQRIEALLARCGFASSGPVRHGRLEALGPRQCLFHRLRQSQAYRLLRHAPGKTRTAGNRGRAGT